MSGSKDSISRRTFFTLGGGVIGSLAAAGCGKKGAPGQTAEEAVSVPEPKATAAGFPEDIPYAGFRMGIQSYCFREFKAPDDLINSLHTMGLAHVELWPDGHLPVDTPLEELRVAVARYKAEGITIDACGVIEMKNDEAKLRKIFEYARELGVLGISAGPEPDAIPLLDKLTAEYGIPIAIHNHGPSDVYWGTSELIRKNLAGTSTMIGLCVDTGHFQRVGEDPLAALDEFPDRIHGIHIKDMVPGQGGEYEDRIVGRGALDLAALVGKLKDMGFKGYFSLEYESDPSNPIPAMKECLEEIKKACKTLS
ncbi:MAG TPA: sugar phosphate isomerase/epimerase family protein [archaeon]|nr:sugar phosphate isomerase/epimerase family protein [archaeon]